jgi:sulfur carrier protein ThiS adenylyltransferase
MSRSRFEDNIRNKLGAEGFRKVLAARIGIAGAGGLGSNCALNLVRSGFRKITIADFDVIDPSNLDRQFYFQDQVGMNKVDALKANLTRVVPGLELKMVKRKIGSSDVEELFGDCDAVAECLDTAESKSMLVSVLMKLGKFTVSASGLGGIGASDDIKTRKIKDGLVMIGDLRSDICNNPAISPRVSVAAAKQADAILEHILLSEKK